MRNIQATRGYSSTRLNAQQQRRHDRQPDPCIAARLPRWVGYFNLWTAILFAPAGLMIFFKTGVFSQNGLIVFWIPVGWFLIWIVSMSALVIQVINAEVRELSLLSPATATSS